MSGRKFNGSFEVKGGIFAENEDGRLRDTCEAGTIVGCRLLVAGCQIIWETG
jgi:hypothetical protein